MIFEDKLSVGEEPRRQATATEVAVSTAEPRDVKTAYQYKGLK
jgi:hypothetical protein